MSHLPLDARAILEYLNELGYRNISAEQLKEFMKGMQPHSEISSKSKPKSKDSSNQQLPASVSAAGAGVSTAKASGAPSPQRSPAAVKVIKCKQPLCHFKFYLDICDHQLTKKIEEQIKTLGGSLEFFLTSSVTHFITDKTVLPPTLGNRNTNNTLSRPGTPQTPATPGTPKTPYSLESHDGKIHSAASNTATPSASTRKTRQTRADAILNRVRRQSTTANVVTVVGIPTTPTAVKAAESTAIPADNSQLPYKVWQTEYALRFFKKVQHELKEYLSNSRDRKPHGKSYVVEPISLKSSFIKIEALKRNYRPYYQLFRRSNATEWPKIELTREDGAFRLSPKKAPEVEAKEAKKMTRKSRSRSSQHQRPLPAAVQSLKKGETGAAACKTSTGGQRISGCKQVKESSDKQCGVCEICKIEYDTLTIHLKTKDHEYFAKNSQNFIALDTLIHSSADVNKFLDDNKKMELEEMEVEEEVIADVNAPDPLEDHAPAMQEEKRRSSSAYKTPSPTLREKSKRSTKGKHSSEKFQQARKATSTQQKSPKNTSPKAATSPQKKPTSSMLEMHRIETVAAKAMNAASTPATSSTVVSRRKPSSSSLAISPPIRAMLPPSSLYKVVESQEPVTPLRRTRDADGGGEQAVASPSLIVKFKKVRQAELHRLNGEAENFMFPKLRTSSELPTDVDRQTTSDNVRASISSTSLDSTSELMDLELENNATPQRKSQTPKASVVSKKAIAAAKRRKGQKAATSATTIVKQSFPIAPIQPEVQLKRLRRPSVAVAATTVSISLPEATRKSSRTATAIVSAATTSSRLLRAAVEAAKNNSRRLAVSTEVTAATEVHSSKRKCLATATKNAEVKRNSRKTVVKMEDRMGDNDGELNTDESDNDEDEENDDDPQDNDEEDEESDDEEDEESDDDQEDDDDDDEDYVHGTRNYYKQQQQVCVATETIANGSTRKQRAARRELLKVEPKQDITETEDDITQEMEVQAVEPANDHRLYCSPSPKKKSSTPQRLFDYNKSERLKKLRYAFERLPAADLWYRVFSRQDACEERYYEYFGSTKYRSLPYEQGPIPFDRTLDGICCKLCNKGVNVNATKVSGSEVKSKLETECDNKAKESDCCTTDTAHIQGTGSAASPTPSAATSTTPYAHKHKKLHLLQRYRQEQQELMQKQQQQGEQRTACEPASAKQSLAEAAAAVAAVISKCDSKDSTPDRERERAGSTHSNASSYASSTATLSKQKYRNKHINKAAFLNLELPPRKSPREHASTLALVSCIIKQRQDSESKPNSETDEPPTTPTPTALAKEEGKGHPLAKTGAGMTTTTMMDVPAVRSPRPTRSAAATPVEELRFTTEISENVKRMRRGQNKYDHSPPIVPRVSRGRGRGMSSPVGRLLHHTKHRSQTPSNAKHRKRRSQPGTPTKQHPHHSNRSKGAAGQGSIRKTGSKKGVLEFEMDSAAVRALDKTTKYKSARQLEWEIDKYLQLSVKDYDVDIDLSSAIESLAEPAELVESNPLREDIARAVQEPTELPAIQTEKDAATSAVDSNTPPPTDCFSSDIDLYDLVASVSFSNGADEDVAVLKRRGCSLYNSIAVQNYFRKRKTLKSNRTGWPKVQKKKSSTRQQQLMQQKIRFLQEIDEVNEEVAVKEELIDDETMKDTRTRESAVITPPDSEAEEDAKTLVNDEDEEGTELDAGESIPEEEDAETMPDSIEDEREADVDVDADVDADEEYDDATAEDEDAEEDDFEPANKRTRNSNVASPVEKLTSSLTKANATATVLSTSTPSVHMLRGLRRTPQLNGSLGSCVSPSEKAGDNSDIFTVSSDGLDTDLDISNSHDPHHQHHHHHHHHDHSAANHTTPKRKFDLSKYTTANNAATTSCAAEAATAAVKSLAISQFLKKEVRVTCRRLRAPFRRFRYRR